MKIEEWPVSRPIPYAKNPRKNEAAVKAVAASIEAGGFVQPLVVDEGGVIIIGHTRLKAAVALGLQTVPVHIARGLSPAKVRALRIADNKTHELSAWDLEILPVELREIELAGIDLTSLGFDRDELDAMLAPSEGDIEDGPAPEPPDVPRTKNGDLITLGRHRLLCGDSTKAADVERLLSGARPALMITDPPYGVEYDSSWRKVLDGRVRKHPTIQNDHASSWADAWRLAPCDVAYVWHASTKSHVVRSDLEIAGFESRAQIVWTKTKIPITRGHYRWAHEPCWYAVRRGANAGWIGDRKQSTVWNIDSQSNRETAHPTQKPVECMARPMRNHRGDAYDPFLGSGSTMVAAEALNRTCYGMEIDPRFCDVIIARWERLTGRKASVEPAPSASFPAND